LEDKVLKSLAIQFPIVEGFRQLRKTANALRSNEYGVDDDGRSHVDLFPFGTKTSRCAPKGRHFIFAAPAWMRGLVRPAEGQAIAYCDYASEEFAFAAFQSQDTDMIECYLSGDPYMAVGIAMKIASLGATKETHPAIRELCKVICLGINYGMGVWGLASRLGISEDEAEELLDRHRQAFPKYWSWIAGQIAHARAHKVIGTPHGWPMYVPRGINERTLQNWPQQALGGDLLSLAAMGLIHEGVQVDALIHDAVLIEGPAGEIDDIVEHANVTMVRASERVLGMPIRVDSQVFRYPDRFHDKREGNMYEEAMHLLAEVDDGE
jgi:DNA polymerase I-like protein with 3'-5' exonuclease and polymerase domains